MTKYIIDASDSFPFRHSPNNYAHFLLGHFLWVMGCLFCNGFIDTKAQIIFKDLPKQWLNFYSLFFSNGSNQNAIPCFSSIFEKKINLKLKIPAGGMSVPRIYESLGMTSGQWWEYLARHFSYQFPEHYQVTLIKRQPGKREITNFHEFSEELQRHCKKEGFRFEVVIFENMPFEDQIKTMMRTSVLVGQHGAGLSNLLFLPPTAKVYELESMANANHFRWLFENSCKGFKRLSYQRIFIDSAGECIPSNATYNKTNEARTADKKYLNTSISIKPESFVRIFDKKPLVLDADK
jgi:hypothetical protein